MNGYLEQLQEDAKGRILAESFFSTVAVIEQRDGITENDIQRRLGALNSRGGKTGLCILILMPVVQVPTPNAPGPLMAITQSFVVLEKPEINRGTAGTGIAAFDAATSLLALFHLASFGYGATLTAAENAIVPNDSFDGLVGLQVNLSSHGGIKPQPRVAWPTISATANSAPATVTIASDTVGANIYYTTDGTYPSGANAAATLYSAPFAQSTSASIRAAAELSGMSPSNVRQISLL
jgi:hypothetical protein